MLRRVDGSSVYTVAGADLYTSQRILDAEQRLITTAGRQDGTIVDESAMDLAVLEMVANGTTLDAVQAVLVRSMCTSGAPGCSWRSHPPGQGRPRPCAPSPRVDSGRRSGYRAGAVRRGGRRPGEQTGIRSRDVGQADLVPAARRAARLGSKNRSDQLW